jgi:hypothetical protein
MLIEGPIKFTVNQGDSNQGYELYLSFELSFQQQPLGQQADSFRHYLMTLNEALSGDVTLDERNRQGILMVQQIVEQLLPHVEVGELDLAETINIHIRPDSPQVSIIDLLNNN